MFIGSDTTKFNGAFTKIRFAHANLDTKWVSHILVQKDQDTLHSNTSSSSYASQEVHQLIRQEERKGAILHSL